VRVIPERIVSFAEALAWARAESGLSLRELSRETGISFTFIHQLEHGVRRQPSPGFVAELAKSLGVHVAQFEARLNLDQELVDWLLSHPGERAELKERMMEENAGVQAERLGR
jgi:transcriptional regulator with XRE-family HTH domain